MVNPKFKIKKSNKMAATLLSGLYVNANEGGTRKL